MLPPSDRDLDELFFRRVIKALSYSFQRTTIIRDKCSLEERDQLFRRFEIYFYLPPEIQSLDGDNIDGVVFFDQLSYQAVRAIENFHEENKHRYPALPAGIGLHTETEWRFGSEVLEAEGMLGDKEDPRDQPLCFSFWARFVQPLEHSARRWRTKRKSLPPSPYVDDPNKSWAIDEDGVIHEIFSLPDHDGIERLRSFPLRPHEPPIFPPRREDYEEDPEEETELDWDDR